MLISGPGRVRMRLAVMQVLAYPETVTSALRMTGSGSALFEVYLEGPGRSMVAQVLPDPQLCEDTAGPAPLLAFMV